MTKDYVSSGSNLHDKAPRCYSGRGAGNQRHYAEIIGEKPKYQKKSLERGRFTPADVK